MAPRRATSCWSSALHDDNVLVSSGGAFRIVDWDGAVIAPHERDLMFFVGGDWLDYMRGYAPGGDTNVDRNIVDYYVLEWALQEIVDYGSRVLFDDRFDADGKGDAMRRFKGLFEEGGDVDRAVNLLRTGAGRR